MSGRPAPDMEFLQNLSEDVLASTGKAYVLTAPNGLKASTDFEGGNGTYRTAVSVTNLTTNTIRVRVLAQAPSPATSRKKSAKQKKTNRKVLAPAQVGSTVLTLAGQATITLSGAQFTLLAGGRVGDYTIPVVTITGLRGVSPGDFVCTTRYTVTS